LSALYFYDKSLAPDSVWLYSGNMNNWKLAASYKTVANPAAWGWKNFIVSQSSRFVMIRFNSYRSVISELVLYGAIRQKLAADTMERLPPLAPPTLAAFAGTNSYDYVQPKLLKPFQQTRLYQLMEWYDTDTVDTYPKNK
jgi:hypothetical protein